MRILQPVLWGKGTFLTPQHLQAQDRFIESVVQFRADSLYFRPWGFSRLKLDHEALAGGMAGVKEASGLFADGTPFEIPESEPAPLAKPLAEFFTPGVDALDVFLALPEYRDNSVNVSTARQSLETRYIAEVATFRDENDGRTERPVQVARKNLRIVVEGENRLGQTLLRVGRVRRTAADTLEYDPAFVPPLLDIRASGSLLAMLRRLLEVLSAKSSMLGALRRQKNQSLAEFTASDIANFWLLYTVNSALPVLRHLYETRYGHPEELFARMLELASVLTTFSLEIQPRDLPAYDHDDLGARFSDLDAKLHHLLETVVPSNFVSLPLQLVKPSIYAASLGEERYLRDTRLFLAVQADVGEAELIQKGAQLIKVCSANHIEHLVRQALPGVELLHQVAPPSAIPVKLDYQYFSLSRSGIAWEAIERSRNFAVYVPGDFPNPKMELVILLPSA